MPTGHWAIAWNDDDLSSESNQDMLLHVFPDNNG